MHQSRHGPSLRGNNEFSASCGSLLTPAHTSTPQTRTPTDMHRSTHACLDSTSHVLQLQPHMHVVDRYQNLSYPKLRLSRLS